MFFTEDNGKKIDGIRIKIEELYRDQTISENEYYFLLASLIESTTKFSNTSGTYEAFFKFWDSRATKDFVLEPLEMNEQELFAENEVYNEETNSLVRHGMQSWITEKNLKRSGKLPQSLETHWNSTELSSLQISQKMQNT